MNTTNQFDWIIDIPDDHPFKEYLKKERIGVLYKCINKLDYRDKKVICMRFGLGGYKRHTFRKIGASIGRTYQTAINIHNKALQTLKELILDEDASKSEDVYKRKLERAKIEQMKAQEMERIARQRRYNNFVDNVRQCLKIKIEKIIEKDVKLLRYKWVPTEAYDILVKCYHPSCYRQNFVLIPYARVQDQIEYLSHLMRVSNFYRLNESFKYADWNAYCFNVCGSNHYRARVIASIFMDFKQKNLLWLNIPNWQYTEYQCGQLHKTEYDYARTTFKSDFKEELQLFYTKPMFKLEDEVVDPIFEKFFKDHPTFTKFFK